ncbi:MAG: hypothetical protein IPI55_19885 [Flavobacteriales bacterium]|nr:hypothetical protein [Flavobacteriales bacterium]
MHNCAWIALQPKYGMMRVALNSLLNAPPGGSGIYSIAPPSSAGTIGDTIAQYRVHTAGPDTLLQRSRFSR